MTKGDLLMLLDPLDDEDEIHFPCKGDPSGAVDITNRARLKKLKVAPCARDDHFSLVPDEGAWAARDYVLLVEANR